MHSLLPHSIRKAAVVVAVIASAACTTAEGDATKDDSLADSGAVAAPHEMAVMARDFAFDIPDTVPAGVTAIRLTNQGTDLHHFALIKLADGKTLDDLLAEARAEVLPSWAIAVGGPNVAPPGGETAVYVDLEPGNYAALCVIPASDGIPHVAKGMSTSFTVVPSDVRTKGPDADIVLTLMDYDFQFSKPLTSGEHVLEVRTAPGQDHELVLIQLAPGKSLNDMLGWVAKPVGPPPGKPIGGTVGLAAGRVNKVPLNLEPGDYALICFFPDHKDGKAHFEHGMMKQITVS